MNTQTSINDMLQEYQSLMNTPNIDTFNNYQLSNLLEKRFGQEKKLSHYKKVYNKITALEIDDINERKDFIKIIIVFAILSKYMKGWYGLISEHDVNGSNPSLDNNLHDFKFSSKKKSNNEIMFFFYEILSNSIDDEKVKDFFCACHSQIKFEKLLASKFDKDIQDAFNICQRSMVDFSDVNVLPDSALAESCHKVYTLIEYTVNFLGMQIKNTKEDLLFVNLLKHASLNKAINDINATIEVQKQVSLDLDDMDLDINSIFYVNTIDDIIPTLSKIFSIEVHEIDNEIIKIAKIICIVYCKKHCPTYVNYTDFLALNTSPKNIAISAFLLLDNALSKKKINTRIRGENNPNILVYKTLKESVRHIDNENIDALIKHGVSETLIKYVTTRYSLMVFGESGGGFNKNEAKAHLVVKQAKIEIQKECYQAFKLMCLDSVIAFVNEFHQVVKCLKSTFEEKLPNRM